MGSEVIARQRIEDSGAEQLLQARIVVRQRIYQPQAPGICVDRKPRRGRYSFRAVDLADNRGVVTHHVLLECALQSGQIQVDAAR